MRRKGKGRASKREKCCRGSNQLKELENIMGKGEREGEGGQRKRRRVRERKEGKEKEKSKEKEREEETRGRWWPHRLAEL